MTFVPSEFQVGDKVYVHVHDVGGCGYRGDAVVVDVSENEVVYETASGTGCCLSPGCGDICRKIYEDEEAPVRPQSFMAPAVDSQGRKDTPVYEGFVRYFPAAMQLVARLSKVGNDKHNPGEPMHHARSKSQDQGDCIIRHQMEIGTIDPDSNLDHAVGVAWRAMAQLQILAEEVYGWPKAPGAK